MKIRVIFLSIIVFFGVISAQETMRSSLSNNEVAADLTDFKINYDNYFNDVDLQNIIKIMKTGDILALESAFDVSEKRLTDTQVKYLLDMIDSTVERTAKKTFSNKDLMLYTSAILALYGLIYLEKNVYIKYDKELSWKIIPYKGLALVSKLFILLKSVPKFISSSIIKLVSKTNFNKKKKFATLSDKSDTNKFFFEDGIQRQILSGLLITILSKLIIDGIYTGSHKLKNKINEIYKCRKDLIVLAKIRAIILKQKAVAIS